ncbi:hypothetical protein ABK040_003499 [Willaertia magna]
MDFYPKPTTTFPNYLFNIFESFSVQKSIDDFTILKQFTNLKTIHALQIPNDYIFDNLPKLEKLYIKDSQLNKNCLSKLTQLKKLSLRYCKFNEDLSLPNHLNNLKLDNYAENDYLIFCNMNQLKHLENLTVTVCKKDYLKELTNLKKLKIHIEKSVDSSFLRNLTNLEYLNITSERILDQDFKNLTKLKYLKIKGFFSGQLIDYLPSLEELHCNFNKIENDAYLKNVERLSLVGRYEPIDLKQFTNLVSLNISSSVDFNGECFLHLINLESLNMASCDTYKIKDEHFINLKKLKSLNISYCNGITGKCFKYLTQLKTLYAEKSEVKEEYLKYLQNIEKLYLTHCNQIVKGEFLLNMNRLNELEVGNEILIFRVEIEKIKKRIEKGELLKEIIKEKVEIEEEIKMSEE